MSMTRHRGSLDPVVMMLAAVALAVVLTWVVPSGMYNRIADGTAVAGSYHVIPKIRASALDIFLSLPQGMARSGPLIFMIMFLGGLFGLFRESGALQAVIERVVQKCGGRTAIIAPVLMVAVSAGSTFLGLASEYLLIIPLALALAATLGRPALFGFALVTVSSKIGYLASATNPVILVIAQRIAGVPLFSGAAVRLGLWFGFLALGILWVLFRDRGNRSQVPIAAEGRLGRRRGIIVALMALAVAVMVLGSSRLNWREPQYGAFYAALAVVIGITAGFSPARTARAFVEGMKSMVLAALVVGMASAVEVVLTEAKVLDSVVYGLAQVTAGMPRVAVAELLVMVEMVLTLLIPSSSAKAAVSLPILVPIARMAGLSGQATVLAFLMGNGLVNMISPTSSMLLAYLGVAELPYTAWFRFVFPLFLVLTVLAFGAVALAVLAGY